MVVDRQAGAGGVPEAMRDALLRRYPLRRLRIAIGSGWLSMVVPDERVWLRKGTGGVEPPSRGGGSRWEPPYWMRVWPAAVAVARLLARAGDLAGLSAMDLGCGLGVPGCQAAKLGCRVHLVDREPDALAFARWNAVRCGEPSAVVATELDWASATVNDSCEVVLLSDVSYQTLHHAPLERTLASVLVPGGCAIHADPIRESSQVFLNRMSQQYRVLSDVMSVAHSGQRQAVRLSLLTHGGAEAERWAKRFAWRQTGAT